VLICEDMWDGRRHRRAGRTRLRPAAWCSTARPSSSISRTVRLDLARARAAESGRPLAYVNLVGGQDELVFDGDSFVIDAPAP
jgi:NAD+ synthase (glutamine-hydrolysing)